MSLKLRQIACVLACLCSVNGYAGVDTGVDTGVYACVAHRVVGIQGEGISIFNSATKPWKIPFIVKKAGKDKIMNILVKFEDVRKDKLTMVVAEYLKKICMTYVDIDLYNVTL